MPHRDPQTGQFVAEQDFNDIETVTFSAQFGVQASALDGSTGFPSGQNFTFEGLELIDYDEIVDRNETLHLLSAHHAGELYGNSTNTADGTVKCYIEFSAAPARSLTSLLTAGETVSGDVVGRADSDDSIDLVGRPLTMSAHSPYTDGATGTGGAGSGGHDSYSLGELPAEMGRFHPRDELFSNGTIETWNISDSGVHVELTGQHVYGVMAD